MKNQKVAFAIKIVERKTVRNNCMYSTEIERRIRRSRNQDYKKANVVTGLPTGYSSVKRRSTGPTVHTPTKAFNSHHS